MDSLFDSDASVMRAAFAQWVNSGWAPRLYSNGGKGFLIVFEKGGVVHTIGKAYYGG